MRATDFCFPLLSTTSTPRFVRYRLLFEAYASPVTADLHQWPRDRWSWHFTMPARFGGLASVCARRFFLFRAARSSRTSDTPVASGQPRGLSTSRSFPIAEAALTVLP